MGRVMNTKAKNAMPDATERSLLQQMAAAVGNEIGNELLKCVASSLRDAMSADFVMITMGVGAPPTSAKAIFALEAGKPAEIFEYDLLGTPCAAVYLGETVLIPADLAKRFPIEDGFEGYVGVPIRASDETVVGHFAALSITPIKAPETAECLIKIFGARIEADLRQNNLLKERQSLIDDLIAVNETLHLRSQALHDANQFKTELMGMIAHDLRSPLSVIVAKAELLQARLSKSSPDMEKACADVGKILHSTDRLTALIETTLTRCRVESAELQLRRRPTEMASLVKIAIETNREAASRKNIELIGPTQPDIWCDVDEGLCLEAVDNLISNAIKYSYPNTAVTATLTVGDSEVQIDVKDEGQGLSASDLLQAFKPFQTLSAQPTAGETATGLGLSNVKSVAEAHGGSVMASSAGLGCGAMFSLRLPLLTNGEAPSHA